MANAIPTPEGEVAKKQLQFFWLADYSGSMGGKKISILNQAIREAVGEIRKAVANHPEVQLMMRAIKFSDNAEWHVGPGSIELDKFVWPELNTAGGTSTAQAIRLLASEMADDKMPRRGCPPVCILISDGFCTDSIEEYDAAIKNLEKLNWAKKAVRLAIAIGDESDYDEGELLKFVTHKEIGVLKAHNPGELVKYVRWASVSASVGASQGRSRDGVAIDDTTNVVLPDPPQVQVTSSTDE